MSQNPAQRMCPPSAPNNAVFLGQSGETYKESDPFSFRWTVTNYPELRKSPCCLSGEILSSSSVKMSSRIQFFLLSALVLILGLVAFTSAHEIGLGESCIRCNVDHFCSTDANLDCCGGTCVCKVGFVLDNLTCIEGQNDANVCAKENPCDSIAEHHR
ncbi:unnamed protein product [Orchesella dallaii]|uniref:TIL domain-containing protein n=1 Tax=Orchesella dallaii TaxID=48710 RepID=A0ABP1R134_9HEXA